MPRPEKQLTPDASPRDWFGYELRTSRKKRGPLTHAELAARVQVSSSLIEKIEKGTATCSKDLAERLDEVLQTGGVLTRAWGMVFRQTEKARPETESAPPSRAEASVQVHEGCILGGGSTTPPSGSPASVDRRAFLATSGLAAIAPIDLVHLVSPAAPREIPTQIRPREIGQLKSLADVIHRQDNEHGGGGAVRELARGAITWGASLLPVPCPEPLRPELLASVARLGIVVGASQFDAYAHDDARVSFRLAAECAEEAGEWHLRAKTYSFMARQEIWVGDPDTGLTHAEKGLVRSDRLTATERAMLHTARARAFAKMCDVGNTLRAVGEADAAFEQSDPAQDPPWMAYYDDAQHHGDTAHALFDLAVHADEDPGQAGRRFEIAVKGHGDAFARSRGISATKLASLVMAKGGDPRHAVVLGHRALDDVGRLTSCRAADDLRELARFAGRYQRLSEARDLRERIAATVQA
ncbi:multiprotein-bridging factor 1 family protein [Streptomyces sp. NPDC059894]|uniref:helix-turn-helix domain-containing protein n=1 Tax=unclassified Streptomyces TaxID=2593676 RepID=UPI0036611CD8